MIESNFKSLIKSIGFEQMIYSGKDPVGVNIFKYQIKYEGDEYFIQLNIAYGAIRPVNQKDSTYILYKERNDKSEILDRLHKSSLDDVEFLYKCFKKHFRNKKIEELFNE